MRHDDPLRAEPGPAETEVSAINEPARAASEGLPERIGPYRVDAVLGRGGMGQVYRAWDPRLERPVAVKRILADASHPKARARFWREARVLAALSHDNLVALHDIGEDGGQLYLAMELIEGRPLADARSARWPLAEAVELVRQLAQAVGTAHQRDIVHRDIKPSNILIEDDGRPRLIDFGLARRIDDDEVTQAGGLVGTWTWMAAEQIAGEQVSPATDVHALGALLFALLVGQPPYQRESKEATAAAILAGARPELRVLRPDVPVALDQLIKSALARDLSKRPRDGDALADSLGRWLASEGFAPDRASLARAFEAARSAIHDPGLSTGLVSRTASRRPRRYWFAAAALAAIGMSALVFLGDGATSAVTIERADSQAAGVAREALRTRPRKTLAILPFRGASGEPHRLGGVVAELLREDLSEADGLVILPWRALLARSDTAPEAMGWGAGEARGLIDGVIDGVITEVGDELQIAFELRQTGGREGLVRLSLKTPEVALFSAMRAAVGPLGRELGVQLDAARLPRGGLSPRGSIKAVELLLEAERALHAEHWRAFRRLIRDALAADPELPRALLHDAQLDSATERPARAKATWLRVQSGDVSERDRSVASVFLKRISSLDEVVEQLERHIQRFPADLEMRLELLRERFLATGKGKLVLAIELAEQILADAPRSTQAASKLVRSLAWTAGVDATRARLAARGVVIEPGVPRVTDFVFAELELYAGRFSAAAESFFAIQENDGDPTYYAAHMRVIAHMLGNRCDQAYEEVLGLLQGARTAEGALGVDWTYLLGINALLCADRLAEAYEMALAWPERVGHTAGAASYRYLVQMIEGLIEPESARFVEEDIVAANWMVIQYGLDAASIRSYLWATRHWQSGYAGMSLIDMPLRSQHGLEARARFLEGDVEGALDVFASLAFGGPPIREGDLYERVRWRGIYAQHLQDAGYVELARENWQGVLDAGFGRALAMDMTWRARVALAR